MDYLSWLDYLFIGLYLIILMGVGLYLKGKASASLENYFIGGRKIPWWALGISGTASWVDVAGTVIIVSFLYMLGPRGLYIELRGGVGLVLVVSLLWTGKWNRRSGCITGAEWMAFRFGEDIWGQFARVAKAFAEIVGTVGMLTYMARGVGLFLSMFLPFSPFTCSILLIGIATLYTMLSGFYGVVYTDLIQAIIVLVTVIGISLMAALKVANYSDLGVLAEQVTGNSDWLNSRLQLHTSMPKGYELYQDLGMFALFYALRNIFFGMGSGDDPKYFGARSDRECGTLSFLWTCFFMFRWPMMIGFATLGLFLINDLFPDQSVLVQTAALIKQHLGAVEHSQWANVLTGIMQNPHHYSTELITGIQNLLGPDWQDKLKLVSFQGTVDPERILPGVMLFFIPKGVRGLILISLIAASMSTFDSTVNRGAGYFTRDIYQRYFRPTASNRELIYVSWAIVALMAGLGIVTGNFVKNINDIWGWIIMGLGGGMLIPLFLRFYWWRFNGSGFALGMFFGIIGAILMKIGTPWLEINCRYGYLLNDERWQFMIMLFIGLLGALIGTYSTRPTDFRVLEHFYRVTRPFGLWGPFKQNLSTETRQMMKREHRFDLLALPFAIGFHITLLMLPMQLIIRTFDAFAVTLIIFLISLTGMYFLWYRHLPRDR